MDQAEAQKRCTNVHDRLALDIVMKLQEMFHKYRKSVGIFHYEFEHIIRKKDFKISWELINDQGESMKGNTMHLTQMKLQL